MRIMYCIYEPFVFTHVVYGAVLENNELSHQTAIYSSTDVNELSHFMAIAYHSSDYEKIVLHGLGADKIVDEIKQYSLTHYNNSNVNIEVVQ